MSNGISRLQCLLHMLKLEELRNRNPHAWTLLLTQNTGVDNLIVEAVAEEPLIEDEGVSRYLLSLANYQEPVCFIGKKTNAVEAMFYEFFGPKLPQFTARCYYHHVGLDEGWLVLADIQNDHPPATWIARDLEIMVGNLAVLHALYWGKRDVLDQYGLPCLLEKCDSLEDSASDVTTEKSGGKQPGGQMARIEEWLQGQQRILTEHALRTAGPSLAPLLAEASKGLETLNEYRGWPGIVDDRHLTALADLLDDPMPVLYPLRQLPCTLLHGKPSPENWRLTLFDDYYLLDWHTTTIGPGVYDLVQFVDHATLLPGKGQNGNSLQAETIEETMVDNYILAMRGELGTRFDTRSTRLAVPAARCLLVLIDWLPRMGRWLREMSFNREVWQAMSELPDEGLEEVGLAELVAWQRSLSLVFDRFLQAYRRL